MPKVNMSSMQSWATNSPDKPTIKPLCVALTLDFFISRILALHCTFNLINVIKYAYVFEKSFDARHAKLTYLTLNPIVTLTFELRTWVLGMMSDHGKQNWQSIWKSFNALYNLWPGQTKSG